MNIFMQMNAIEIITQSSAPSAHLHVYIQHQFAICRKFLFAFQGQTEVLTCQEKQCVGLKWTVLKALPSLHGINMNAQFIPKDTLYKSPEPKT